MFHNTNQMKTLFNNLTNKITTQKHNWIASSDMMNFLKPTIEINKNPYYQKWKRGRPTKQMIRQRELWQKWELENNDTIKLFESLKEHKLSYNHNETIRL